MPGETITWSGDCVNGKASGEGEVVWRGSYGVEIYTGEYRNGYENGHGEYTSTDGNRYRGEWRDGKFFGHGVFAWADGDRYEGEWRDGKPHGDGILIGSDGGSYEGEWRDGCLEANGRRMWINTTPAACGFE